MPPKLPRRLETKGRLYPLPERIEIIDPAGVNFPDETPPEDISKTKLIVRRIPCFKCSLKWETYKSIFSLYCIRCTSIMDSEEPVK